MRVIGVATIDEQSRRLPTDVYSARKGHSIFISHCAAFLVLMWSINGHSSLPRPPWYFYLRFRHFPRREWATFRRRENLSCHTPLAASRARPLHRRGLDLGPKAVAGQRGRPHSARVAASRASEKRTKLSFFSYT